MRAILAEAMSRWPGIDLDPAVYTRWRDDHPDHSDDHGDELYLACACAAGVPAALAAFEQHFLTQVDVYLRGVRATPDLVDEVRQELRQRLFSGERPRIADYSGKGSLGAWLRVAAIRVASNLRRAEGTRARLEAHGTSGDELQRELPLDPELALIRGRYKGAFTDAMRDAFAALAERERNLLRLHFQGGVGVDGLAPVFGVHRATAARWLAAARDELSGRVLELLKSRLAVDARELESLARVVRSDLDVSLRTLLA